jgi:GxxExxY protein
VIELASIGLNFEIEFPITVRYRRKVGKHRIDLLIESAIVVELKVVEERTKRHYRQLRSFLKSAKINSGLLINFDDEKLDFRRVDASTKPHTSPPSP